MKILKIEFENINSLAGGWEIDLSRGEYRDGLFLISGDTGAGKTSILDAVTLALFGETARVGISAEHDEVMTRGAKKCHAMVTFACADGVYRSGWSHARTRGNSAKPFGAVERTLEKQEDGVWKGIAGTAKQLQAEIQRLIGAESFDQFQRTAMLAQGKFDKFLSSEGKESDKERSKILEQATGTEIYSRIGQAIHERCSKANKALSDEKKLREGAESTLFSDEVRAAKAQKLSVCRAEEAELVAKVKALQIEDQWQKDRAALESQKGKLDGKAAAIGRRREAFAADDARATQAEAARKLCPEAERVRSLSDLAAEKKNELKSREEALAKAREEESSSKGKRDAARKTADDARKKLEARLPDIDRAVTLDREIAAKKGEADTVSERLTNSAAAVEAQEKILAEGSPFIDGQRSKMEELQKQRGCRPQALVAAEGALRIRSREREEAIAVQEAVDLECEHRFGDLDRDIGNARQDLLDARRIQDYEEARKTLEEGHACPLCGATEHPYCANLVPQVDKFAVRLKGLEDAKAELEKRQRAARRTFSDADRNFRAAEEALKRLQEAWCNEESRLGEEIARCQQCIEERQRQMSDAQAALPGLKAEAERIAAEQAKLEAERKQLVEQRNNCHVEGDPLVLRDTLQKSVETAVSKTATEEAAYAACESAVKAAGEECEKARTRCEKVQAEGTEAVKTFGDTLRAAGYADEGTWRAACWNDRDFEAAVKTRGEIKSESDGLAALQNEHKKLTDAFAARPKSDRTAAEVAGELVDKTKQHDAAHDAAVKLEQELKSDEEDRQKVEELVAKIGRLEQEAARWASLDGELGGEKGANFKLYAQGITLAQLIECGNRYLKPMTHDRYEMIWDPENEDAEHLLPTIVDRRAGGERRPVINLSGGERFQVSLALALGLSELNAGRLCVETLFLDEGFGTLDEATLDVSIATLEGVQRDGSKTIGIISHVRELEERLATKIVATKTGNGVSTLSGPGVIALAPVTPASRRRKAKA